MNLPTLPRPKYLRRLGLASLLGVVSFQASSQTLSVTEGLSLWLKADAGVTADAEGAVSAWNDQSGQNNHALQPDSLLAPTVIPNALNGQPVLRFDGADDFLEVADSESLSNAGDITSFFVVKFDDFATFRAVWAKTAVNLPASTDYYLVPNSGVPRVYRGNGTSTGLGNFDGTPLRAGTYLLAGFGIEGDQASHFLSSQTTTTVSLTADVADADTPLLIGTRQDLVTRLKGDLAELLIYDRALSASDRAAVVDYLASKYAIQNLPPTVSLARTPAGASVEAGTTLTLTATASDPDGSIARVEFLGNGALLATASAPPYRARVTVKTAGTYRFSARAVDDKDAPAVSTELSVTATGSGGTPTLGVTSNLQLWVRADAGVTADGDGNVTAWSDQSGQANHASQGDPTFSPAVVADGLNGLPVLRFDGDDYLDVQDSDSLSITGDITSLFVVKMDDFATFRAVWGKTLINQPAPTDYYTLPGTGVPRLYRGDSQGSIGSSDGGAPFTAGAFQLAGFASASGNTLHILNGSVTATGVIAAVPGDMDTPLKIGTRDDFFTSLLGDLAELLIYDVSLSSTDLDAAQTYLAVKYGISLLAPTNTPPVATLTAPAPNATFASPATVNVEAVATDDDGAVAYVEFRVNGALAASVTNRPYATTLSFPTADESLLTAVVVDNLGARSVSDPVPIRVTSTAQLPLPAAPRLKLWLKADAGTTVANDGVSVWEDQSGNLNHAAQTNVDSRPLLAPAGINNLPALRFDGDNDSLAIPHSLSLAMVGDLTTFFVVRIDDFDTFRAVWAKTDGNQPRATDFYFVPNTGIPRALRGGVGAGSFDGTDPLIAGEVAIVGFDMAGTAIRHWLNGALNGEGILGGTFLDSGRPLRIGTRDDGATRLRGDLAELILYNTSLSAADRSAVVAYLGAKYGIPVAAGPPQINVARAASGTEITLSWPAGASDYVLQTSTQIVGGTWQDVPGVTGNSITVPVGAGPAYFRLTRP